MTNKEALEILDTIPTIGEQVDALEMAIKALEQQPSDDCVSRQEVLDVLKDKWNMFSDANDAMQESIATIEALPPVTPQPEVGRWMRKTKVDGLYDISGVKTWGVKCQCDRCDFTTTVIEDFGYYTYCPNCGAKMEVEE